MTRLRAITHFSSKIRGEERKTLSERAEASKRETPRSLEIDCPYKIDGLLNSPFQGSVKFISGCRVGTACLAGMGGDWEDNYPGFDSGSLARKKRLPRIFCSCIIEFYLLQGSDIFLCAKFDFFHPFSKLQVSFSMFNSKSIPQHLTIMKP